MESRSPVKISRHLFLRRNAGFRFLFSIFSCSSLLAGCASPGEPIERRPPVPRAVTDLAAQQSGNDVILTFTLPKETVDNRELKQPPAIEIYREFRAVPVTDNSAGSASIVPANPALHITIPSGMVDHYVEQGRVRYADSLKAEDFSQHPGSEAVYTVRGRASTKRESADSNAAHLRVYPAPDAIEDVTAEITHSGVMLKWTAPAKTLIGPAPPLAGYCVYRAEAETTASTAAGETPALKSPLARVGTPDSPAYFDTQVEFDHTYVYSIRSVAQYPDILLESAGSRWVVVAPKDIFPPAAPQGLVVVLVPTQGEIPAHLELSWAISPETDIAGYNIYRSEQAGAQGTRLNEQLLQTPAFRDMNGLPGRRYFYSVTAVDRAGNESPASTPASAGIPDESKP